MKTQASIEFKLVFQLWPFKVSFRPTVTFNRDKTMADNLDEIKELVIKAVKG